MIEALQTRENYSTLLYKPDGPDESQVGNGRETPEPELYQAIGSEVTTSGEPALYAVLEPATEIAMNRRSFLANEVAVTGPMVQRDVSGAETVMDDTF
jgi:hypothetical protein